MTVPLNISAGGGGPSGAEAAAYGTSGQDNSGWAVNFAGQQNATSSQDKSGGVPGVGISGIGGSIPWWAWAAVGGLILWRLKSKK